MIALFKLAKETCDRLKKIKIGAFGKTLIKFASTQLIYNGLRMIAGFLIVRLIAPEIYGAFSGVGVFLGYVMLGHIGIINGLGRELPFQSGKGNLNLVKDLAALGLWVSIVIGVIASVIFLTILIHRIFYGTLNEVFIFSTYTIVSFFHLLNKAYLPVLYRTNKEFAKLSKINIGLAFINIISVLFVWQYGLYGLCYRALTIVIFEFRMLYYYRPVRVTPSWNYDRAKLLLKTGFPIYAVGHIGIIWNTVANNLIFSLGGPLQFGYYALARIVNGALGILPKSISSVVYPRMTIQLGEGKSVKSILRGIVKPTIFQFLIILISAMVTFYLLPIIVPILLPKYTNGIEVAQWIVFIPVIQSLGLVNNIYNVLKQQKWHLFSSLLGAITGIGYSLFMVYSHNFNLVFFAQGMLVGYSIKMVLSFIFLNKLKF